MKFLVHKYRRCVDVFEVEAKDSAEAVKLVETGKVRESATDVNGELDRRYSDGTILVFDSDGKLV